MSIFVTWPRLKHKWALELIVALFWLWVLLRFSISTSRIFIFIINIHPFLRKQILIKLLFKLNKFIHKIIPLGYPEISRLPITFPLFLVCILWWECFVLDSILSIAFSTGTAFGVHGETASVVFCVKHEKLFWCFWVEFVGDQFLLLLLKLLLIFKYTLFDLFFLCLFILINKQQLCVISKIKWFIYIFQRLINTFLLFCLSCFLDNFSLVLVILGCKNVVGINFLVFSLSWSTCWGFVRFWLWILWVWISDIDYCRRTINKKRSIFTVLLITIA